MLDKKKIIAVIPARGGSKRLQGKNILDFSGKPLIVWTISAALRSKYIDRVIVSTDDNEIAEISKKSGAEVPFVRPDALATEYASSIDVVIHAIEVIETTNNLFDYVVLLQPTSPLRTSLHIDEAIELLFEKEADSVISVSEAANNPLWCGVLPEDLNMTSFLDDKYKNTRSQDLPKYYVINGAIYICEKNRLVEEKTFFLSNNVYAYPMDKLLSIDIDTREDLDLAVFVKEKYGV